MYLTAYHFDGAPDRIMAGYDQMMQGFPPDSLELHVAVLTYHGITVFDGCPTYDEAVAFSKSDAFLKAIADAGLPAPRVELLGEIHNAVGVSR